MNAPCHRGLGSLSGIITYKNAVELRDSLNYIPLDRLLIETDSPFLALVPHRGKLNEPAYVAYVAAEVAKLLRKSANYVANKPTVTSLTYSREPKQLPPETMRAISIYAPCRLETRLSRLVPRETSAS